MKVAATIAIAFVAFEHFGFLVLEMFLWTKPFGRLTFGLTPELAKASASLAANQGLYDEFFGSGLVMSLFADFSVSVFFLSGVIGAGVFGSFTS